ncbi:hypothetical protein KEM48_002718 [Puccinia striiformis f. sp. tritici PST-130]|nr:hypothetical protein KEM48_002718 [Puccinia striiformis f. sp. tritici PST-130]
MPVADEQSVMVGSHAMVRSAWYWVTLHEHGSFKWRHWGCLTSPVLKNVSNELEGKIEELDGFEELQPADQDKIKKAFEDGKVDPADLPPTAVPEKIDDPVEEDGKKETKKRKRAPKLSS